MATPSFFSRVFKGLADGLFTVEIGPHPVLAQEINELFADKKTTSAFKKLAGQTRSVVFVCVPGEYGTAFLPPGRYEVSYKAEWETAVLLESLIWEYVDEVAASPTTIVGVAARALSQTAPENDAARMALARLMDATLAVVLATANRKQLLQVYGGTASPVMIPVELLALPLIFRRAFDFSFSEAVEKYQDHLPELLFQETSQEVAPGIGFKVGPTFQKSRAQGQVAELQRAYVTAAWAFSGTFVRVVATSDTDYSEVRTLWRKAASLLNQIDDLESQSAGRTSAAAPAQSATVKRWVRTYMWSLSWGMITLLAALLLRVKPLFDVGDSVVLSVLASTLALAAAAPIVFHTLDGVGYYSLAAIAASGGSLWCILDTMIGDRTIHDQTTWIWLFVAPLMLVYEIFRDKGAKEEMTEEWRKGIV